jgi:hypothetical protein
MNIFCKLLGHTWVHKTDDPKIAWNTTKNMDELAMTADGEPRFYQQCARCGDERDLPRRASAAPQA